jgi:hypothetical protein
MREATEVGTTHLGAPGPPGTPRCLVTPSRLPSGTSLAQQVSSGPEKISKKFRYDWTPFDIIFRETKTGQKTATGTGHYVNRLVPKNDVKLL